MTAGERERWNARHAAGVASGAPADWVAEHRGLLDALPRGRALDVACGLGRNALFLARLGFEVDAVDVSDVAVERLSAAAAAEDLPVHVRRADLSVATAIDAGAYAVVVNTFFLERALLPALAGALAPGGLLVFETFSRDHPRVSGRAMPERMLLAPNELLAAFAGLRILRYRDAEIHDERPRAVASLVARRAQPSDAAA